MEIDSGKYLIMNYQYRFFNRSESSEEWQFMPGDIVECYECTEIDSVDNLLAYKKIEMEF